MSNPSNETIRHSAFRLRLLVFAAMGIMALLYLAALTNLGLGHAHVEYRLHGEPFEHVIGAGSLVLLLVALLRLTQMLDRIAQGELFSASVIRHFRAFALFLLLMALFELVAPAIASLITAAASTPHLVRLNVDVRDVMTVGVTLLLFLLARLLEQARRLDEEMREIV